MNFDWHDTYHTASTPQMVRYVMATSQPQAACSGPRFKWSQDLDVDFESPMSQPLLNGLQALSYRFVPSTDICLAFGCGQLIARLSGRMADGQARGF